MNQGNSLPAGTGWIGLSLDAGGKEVYIEEIIAFTFYIARNAPNQVKLHSQFSNHEL
jgi:hypothetical protein